mmetsp:Transcript_19981/g.43188  ORF Transcript_19981/g.43188 Transcript_19981/m.43188 type:complete len:271 (+) Transcript_19981:163-975(+)
MRGDCGSESRCLLCALTLSFPGGCARLCACVCVSRLVSLCVCESVGAYVLVCAPSARAPLESVHSAPLCTAAAAEARPRAAAPACAFPHGSRLGLRYLRLHNRAFHARPPIRPVFGHALICQSQCARASQLHVLLPTATAAAAVLQIHGGFALLPQLTSRTHQLLRFAPTVKLERTPRLLACALGGESEGFRGCTWLLCAQDKEPDFCLKQHPTETVDSESEEDVFAMHVVPPRIIGFPGLASSLPVFPSTSSLPLFPSPLFPPSLLALL